MNLSLTDAFGRLFSEAQALQVVQRYDDAIALYHRLMRMRPTCAAVHVNLGTLLYSKGHWRKALALFCRAIALDPELAGAWVNYASVLNAMGRHEDCIAAAKVALQYEPDHSRAMNNMADSLNKTGRYEEGRVILARAIALSPRFAEARSNYAMSLYGLGLFDAAETMMRSAIAIRADIPMMHENLAYLLLLRGAYDEAWPEYEHRRFIDKPGSSDMPRWDGKPLDGPLLVWAEQGIGDQIFHFRLARELVERGFHVKWQCDPRLVKMFRAMGIDAVGQNEVVAAAAQIPAGSVFQYVGGDPVKTPYAQYLSANYARHIARGRMLARRSYHRIIGLSWRSTNVMYGKSKTMALDDLVCGLEEFFFAPEIRFVDLQYGDTAAERLATEQKFGIQIEHIAGLDLKDDQDGLAALIACCNAVVTVSNSVTHLACALARPTYVMVPKGIGRFWYWGPDGGTSTPWYQTAHVFHQEDSASWAPTIAAVARKLASGL